MYVHKQLVMSSAVAKVLFTVTSGISTVFDRIRNSSDKWVRFLIWIRIILIPYEFWTGKDNYIVSLFYLCNFVASWYIFNIIWCLCVATLKIKSVKSFLNTQSHLLRMAQYNSKLYYTEHIHAPRIEHRGR